MATHECPSINPGPPGSPSAAEGNGPSEYSAIFKAYQDSMNTSGTESKPHAKNVAGLIPRISTALILTGALIPLFILDALLTPQGYQGLPSVVAAIAVYAYWLFFVYRLHLALQEITDDEYPISPGDAAAFNLLPLYNWYWMFKWPAEFSRFINGQGTVRVMSGAGLGILLLVSHFLVAIPPVGLSCLFGIAAYLSGKLRRSLEC